MITLPINLLTTLISQCSYSAVYRYLIFPNIYLSHLCACIVIQTYEDINIDTPIPIPIYQTIVLEDLNVSGMVRNRKLARSISLQGWREFRDLCEAKSEKFGREFLIIDRWEPTSQICSACCFKWGKLDLKVRSLKCLNCGTEHDRDENAAKNIELSRHRALGDSKRTQRQSQTTSVASVSEASRITVASAR